MGDATITSTEGASRAELLERGRAMRAVMRRSDHAELVVPSGRDALTVLHESNATRLADLVPVRWARMADSEFGFFRGAPAVMATDLAGTGVTGIRPQLCGDAHLANFGLFATAERRLVFDLNDFDETLAGPFDWDVKRLGASLVIAGRAAGHSASAARRAAAGAALAYAQRVGELSTMSPLEIWHVQLDVDTASRDTSAGVRREIERTARDARGRTHLQAFRKMTTVIDGQRRIVADPPLVTPLRMDADLDALRQFFDDYLGTLPSERRHLLRHYRLADAARKVVGVGSVGTRCYIALGIGHAVDDPVFLQIKQAQQSVLEPHLGASPHDHAGERVVVGQRLLQASSDPFLGWARGPGGYEFFVRQLRDMKGGFDVETFTPGQMRAYATACGRTLARAHARTLHPALIAGYLGRGTSFAEAVAEFGVRYARQNREDHALLVDAIRSGDIVTG